MIQRRLLTRSHFEMRVVTLREQSASSSRNCASPQKYDYPELIQVNQKALTYRATKHSCFPKTGLLLSVVHKICLFCNNLVPTPVAIASALVSVFSIYQLTIYKTATFGQEIEKLLIRLHPSYCIGHNELASSTSCSDSGEAT